jgi:hypothetical protein
MTLNRKEKISKGGARMAGTKKIKTGFLVVWDDTDGNTHADEADDLEDAKEMISDEMKDDDGLDGSDFIVYEYIRIYETKATQIELIPDELI